jgi:hypothetical protein
VAAAEAKARQVAPQRLPVRLSPVQIDAKLKTMRRTLERQQQGRRSSEVRAYCGKAKRAYI